MIRTEPLRVAVVGAGYFSAFHQQAWSTLPGARLVAICDRDPDKARQASIRCGAIDAFDDAGEMFASVRPDIVDIVTPPETHLELVWQAARVARLIVCQKPLAPTLEDACEIVRIAEHERVPLMVHENFRFAPWYREAYRLLRSGMIGLPHAVAFRLRPGDGQGPRAYLDRQPYFRAMQRFLIQETAIHFVDTFRFLLGEVDAVTARLRRVNPTIEGEDAGYVIFEFAGGATGLFDGNRLNEHDCDDLRRTMGELWLEGSLGVLRLDGRARLWFKPHGGGPEREHPYDRGPDTFAGGAVRALQSHVLEVARGECPPENAARAYLRNIEIQEAIYRSHREGRRIALARPTEAGDVARHTPGETS